MNEYREPMPHSGLSAAALTGTGPMTGLDVTRTTRSPWDSAGQSDVLGSNEPEAISLGRFVDPLEGIAERMKYGGEQHCVLVGVNGAGKGTRCLIPNLLEIEGNKSIVVVDVKGELAAVTAPWRRTVSDVYILNPFNVLVDVPGYEDLKSCGFNPFASVDPDLDSFNADSALFSEALIKVNDKEPHWGDSARALSSMCLADTVMEARRLKRPATMSRFRDMLCEASDEEDKSRGKPARGICKRAERLQNSPIAGLRNKSSQFTLWNKETQGIASTARAQTESFDDVEIARDMSKGGLDFTCLRKSPTTVYLILPERMLERHGRWLRLVLTCAFRAVMGARAPGEARVLFMIDEFFALGKLDIISTVWALVRGSGIQIMPVLQDLNQLQKLYPDMWRTFVGMAGAVINFSTNDDVTADWLSKRAGETTRDVSTTSSNHSVGFNYGSGSGVSYGQHGSVSENFNSGRTWNKSDNVNHTQIRAPLITPHKFYGLRDGFMTVALCGQSNLIPGYASPYFRVRQRAMRARDNPWYQKEEGPTPTRQLR